MLWKPYRTPDMPQQLVEAATSLQEPAEVVTCLSYHRQTLQVTTTSSDLPCLSAEQPSADPLDKPEDANWMPGTPAFAHNLGLYLQASSKMW